MVNEIDTNAKTREESADQTNAALKPLKGKTVSDVRADPQLHGLDDVYSAGGLELEFTDGSILRLDALWCNDDTAAICLVVSAFI